LSRLLDVFVTRCHVVTAHSLLVCAFLKNFLNFLILIFSFAVVSFSYEDNN
jgi:hypothetical protein